MMKTTTHFIGIGGIGMSALARLVLQKGASVTGSDLATTPLTEELKNLGAHVSLGHDKNNLPAKGRIVVSTDIKADNPELSGCDPENHKIIHRSDLLHELMQDQKALLVCGTHGKTTTSSLLATVLTDANQNPSWAVGGIIAQYGTNSALGSGEYFVAEADESDGTHLKYHPYGLILTNLNEDHMSHYKTRAHLLDSFRQFIKQVSSAHHFFWCGDSEGLQELQAPGFSYGFAESNDLKISNFYQEEKHSFFDVEFEGKKYIEVQIPLLGRHNALNASAVFGLAIKLGLQESAIRQGLMKFKGAKRRLDIKSDTRHTLVIDDYAHHPNEIKATLSAIRGAYPERRVIVVFQPHRFSRTKDCFDQFAPSLELADKLFVTDIYAAGEKPIEGVSIETLIKTMPHATYVPRGDLVDTLANLMRPFDIVVTLGAGDITKVSEALAQKTPRKLKVGCLFGGRSAEHDVSLISAKNVSQSFEEDLFDIEYIGITKKGEWVVGDKARDVLLKGDSWGEPSSFDEILKTIQTCDVAFPVLHGTFGEDGTIQGFFEMLNVPYIGCGVESSAIAMNKATTKKLAEWAGIPVADFIDFIDSEWGRDKEIVLSKIRNKLTYPLFVKPVHLGSTFGVVKVKNEKELLGAIQDGLSLDTQFVVEEGIVGREIECSVIGRGSCFVSIPGEICTNGAVYDYESKYGQNAIDVKIQADLTEEQTNQAKSMALAAYRAIGADGFARVDLFLQPDGKFLLNEINPIPGCTRNSLFPKMAENSGLKFSELIVQATALALGRKVKQDRII